MRSSRVAVASLALAVAAGLAGCQSVLPGGWLAGPYACASWVGFETPQDMYDEATLVIEGVVGSTAGKQRFATGPGELHEVHVAAAHKGEHREGTLLAASPRDYCVESPPGPAEDPLQEGERVLLFLHPFTGADPLTVEEFERLDLATVERWSTLTPYAGVLAHAEGEPLPFESLPFDPGD